MRWKASGFAATGDCRRSAATRTGSTWSASRTPSGRGEVLPAGALDGCRDRRGTRLCRRARRARDSGRRAHDARRPHAACVGRPFASRSTRSAAAARPSSTGRKRSNGWAASSGASTRSARLKPFSHRPPLDIRTFGIEPRDWLLAHDFVPPDLLDAWRVIAAQALDGVRALLRPRRRCANAAAARRLSRRQRAVDRARRRTRGPHFVDFDDARMGPAVQDLWMLLSGDRADMSRQLGHRARRIRRFLRVRSARAPSRRGAAHVAPPSLLGVARAERWDDPAFPAAFPWFNTQRYWQDRILELREQVALMDEPPLGST